MDIYNHFKIQLLVNQKSVRDILNKTDASNAFWTNQLVLNKGMTEVIQRKLRKHIRCRIENGA